MLHSTRSCSSPGTVRSRFWRAGTAPQARTTPCRRRSTTTAQICRTRNLAGVDFSEAFLANEWNVTRTGGATQSASDAASIAAHGSNAEVSHRLARNHQRRTRPRSPPAHVGEIQRPDDTRYFSRSGSPPTYPTLAEAILKRDIGDRVRDHPQARPVEASPHRPNVVHSAHRRVRRERREAVADQRGSSARCDTISLWKVSD